MFVRRILKVIVYVVAENRAKLFPKELEVERKSEKKLKTIYSIKRQGSIQSFSSFWSLKLSIS